MTTTTLPSWESCERSHNESPDDMTPMEIFIYDNEPIGLSGKVFRAQLEALLEYNMLNTNTQDVHKK